VLLTVVASSRGDLESGSRCFTVRDGQRLLLHFAQLSSRYYITCMYTSLQKCKHRNGKMV